MADIDPDEAYLSTCKHSFSNAILQFITQAGGRCECPVSGCRSYLTANDVAIDRGLRRRIQKFRESQVEEDDY